MNRSVPCLFLLACAAACVSAGPSKTSDAELLAAWLSGSFNSHAQCAAEAASGADEMRALVAQHAEHADVRMHAVPVWTDREDGRWLYVERERANRPGSAYFERVVHVHFDGHALVSDTYLLPGDEHRFDGAWRTPKALADVDVGSLVLRAGSRLHWSRTTGGTFSGVPEYGSCSSVLQGATHATSRMTVSSSRITSWDQGFDDAGKQVWGVTSGPYVLDREDGNG
jgi:hypothetical protein